MVEVLQRLQDGVLGCNRVGMVLNGKTDYLVYQKLDGLRFHVGFRF